MDHATRALETAAAIDDALAPDEPLPPAQPLPPVPGVTLHRSRTSDRVTIIVDVGITAAELTAGIARLLPAVRLTEVLSDAGVVMLAFQPVSRPVVQPGGQAPPRQLGR